MTVTTAKTSSQYRDITDVADQLGVSIQTLYRWRSEGHDMPKAFKVGSRVRWTQESIDQWVAKQIRAAE